MSLGRHPTTGLEKGARLAFYLGEGMYRPVPRREIDALYTPERIHSLLTQGRIRGVEVSVIGGVCGGRCVTPSWSRHSTYSRNVKRAALHDYRQHAFE